MTDYPDGTSAIVLMIGPRYFVHCKYGRLVTAWSLAGATLFGPWDSYGIGKAEELLRKKKHDPVQVIVRAA